MTNPPAHFPDPDATTHGFPLSLIAAALDAAVAVPRPEGGAAVFAIGGLQGSGKSTLAAQVVALARSRGVSADTVSIDDFYLTGAERQQLATDVHPLLATRGPPGTHDLALATATLAGLRSGRPTPLPRFDKLADDRVPADAWRTLAGLQLVVFEGWFLGTPAQAAAELAEPINALERAEDPDGTWRRWCNAALARDYPTLWAHMDALWWLQGPGFDVVLDWRGQQERGLVADAGAGAAAAATAGPAGMDAAALARFIQHYERVSRQAWRTLPALADHTVHIDAGRRLLPGGA